MMGTMGIKLLNSVTGLREFLKGTEGAAHVKLPQNSYGTVSVGELVGTGTEATTTYNFPAGLNGVTVFNSCPAVWNTATVNVRVYVAFNNTAFNDASVAGLRYVVGPNDSLTFSFSNTPKPTQMQIRIDATQCTAFYIAAEDA